MNKTLAVIAGQGQLPLLISQEAKRMGYNVVFVALEPLQSHSPETADTVQRVNIGRFGKLLKILKSLHVEEIVMAGKVPKALMYRSNIVPDTKALKLLKLLKDRRDDTIMNIVTSALEEEGFRVRNTTDFTESLLIKKGIHTKRKPTKEEKKDIAFGFAIAKELGRLDIGQTVVVKSRAVMALEAIEGTDETILRGGRYAGKDAVIVKVSKPQQDMRYDVPVVGINTLQSMLQVKASVLAVEAHKTIAVNLEDMVSLANANKITIIAVDEDVISEQ